MLRRLLLLVLPLLALLIAAPAPPAAAEQTTWSIAPATVEGADGRISFRHELAPGDTVTEHVAVTNHGSAPAVFDLYASDGVITDDGGFDLLPADTPPTGSGAWVELVDTVEVPAASEVVVPFTVAVPDDATPGDHPAGVVAALRSTAAVDGQLVSVDSRVGVRLHLRVTGDLVPALAVTDVEVDHHGSWHPFAPGRVEVSWTVRNEGNVRLGTDAVTVRVGGTTATAPATREVLPGGEVRDSVVVDGVWPLVRQGGSVQVTPVVVGEDVVDPAPAAVESGFTVWTPPWPQLGLLAGLLLVAWLVRTARRRSRARFAAAVTAARAETRAEPTRPTAGVG